MDGLKARKVVVWCCAAAGACVPAVLFAVSLGRARLSQPQGWGFTQVVNLVLAPGVFPGMMFRSWVVQVVVAGVFWGVVLGAVGSMVLLKWGERGRVLQVVTVLGAVAAVYGVLVARWWAGWSAD